jgi:hypothetical protein
VGLKRTGKIQASLLTAMPIGCGATPAGYPDSSATNPPHRIPLDRRRRHGESSLRKKAFIICSHYDRNKKKYPFRKILKAPDAIRLRQRRLKNHVQRRRAWVVLAA